MTPAPSESNPTRHRLLLTVAARPGIHFRALGRAAGCSAGQLRHHLTKLQRSGFVLEVADGRYRRFFLAGRHAPNLREAVALLHRPGLRPIAHLLLEGPRRRGELRPVVGCAESTLSFHLDLMARRGMVAAERDGAGLRYVLTEPETVREALALVASGGSVDTVGEGWRRAPRGPLEQEAAPVPATA